MSPLDSFWSGVLSVLAPLITPDWGKLVVLIPWLLLLLVLAFLGRVVMAWMSLYQAQPVRGPKVRKRSLRPLVTAHIAVLVLGAVVVAAAFVVGARDPSWQGLNPPAGLVVNLPLLVVGFVIAVGAAGSGARTWDRFGREVEPDVIDKTMAILRRHPGRARRAVAFALGVVLAAAGLGLGTAPGQSDQPLPVAVLPLLLLGLVLAVGAVGASIAAVWSSDPDFDGAESSALVATEH